MCTLIVLHRCVPGRPLVVAANRDEFYARPAEGPAIRETGVGKILAPVDLEAGGTWLGLNERGVFAGLTNLRPWTATDGTETLDPSALANSGQRSRGEVVMSALEARSAAEAARRLERLEVDAYNPFQLVVADAQEAWLIVYRDRPGTIALASGVHVVGNVEDERVEAELVAIHGSPGPAGAGGLGGIGALSGGAAGTKESGSHFRALSEAREPRALKLTRVRERVEKMVADSHWPEGAKRPDPVAEAKAEEGGASRASGRVPAREPERALLEGLAGICREHVEDAAAADGRGRGDGAGRSQPGNPSDSLESTCVHIAGRYGTRSSLLLEIAEQREASRLWASDGPPCERPYQDLSPLLRELDLRSGMPAGAEREVRTNR
ncbi:MAG: NRDE family protein [Deltaproteobacteria bacterium]|jgi:uncharacterized protein with NRDE domain|nr:NRDE family protein [Deltaproteobacteria bacterium]